MKNKRIQILSVTLIVIAVLLAETFMLKVLLPNVQKILMSEEDKLAMTYYEFTDDDYKTDSDNVRFLAFFERDLDRDGLSEKLAGTTKNMSNTDTLYLDINVVSDGVLKDGVVTFSNDSNFKYSMNMRKDAVLSKNYISDNVKRIEFNNLNAGTQELIVGGITPNTSGDDYYSKITKVTLTGVYIPSDPNQAEIQINKTIDLTVDWYGATSTSIDARHKIVSKEWITDEDRVNSPEISLNFSTMEELNQLILKNTTVSVEMPALNGKYPTDVVANGASYDKDKHILTISRDSILGDDGRIESYLSRKNSYSIIATYPDSAYREMYEEWKNSGKTKSSIRNLVFRISASYTGYNNPNYAESRSSASASSTIVVKIGADDPGYGPEIYAYVDFNDKQLIGRNNWDNDYGVEKQPLRDAWYSEEDRAYYYTVKYKCRWDYNGTEIEDGFIEMEAPEADKLGGYDLYNVGSYYAIYGDDFTSLTDLGAKVYVYDVKHHTGIDGSWNGETDETLLLKYGDGDAIEAIPNAMNAEEYVEYFENKAAPLGDVSHMRNLEFLTMRDEQIQDIKFKITDIPDSGDCEFYVVKKIDFDLLDYLGYDATNLESANNMTANLYARLNYDENQTHLHSEDADIIKLVDLKSYAGIKLSNTHFEPGEENTQRNINITAGRIKFGDSTWKDGIFVVEFPESIINMEINDIQAHCYVSSGTVYTNSDMTIKGWNLEKENNKYYLKILAENFEEAERISINIDANMVVDPRPGIAALNNDNNVKLYFENGVRKQYYDSTKDILDINGNINIEEYVGLATTEINIASPTSMLTFQTVTDYDTEGSITVAPNIADISKETRSAKINLSVINGYSANVTDTKILGKVPYENNKYVLTPDKYMGSDFSATMKTGGITVPESIRANTKVYYSEVGEPTADLNNPSNGWKTAEQVTNWSLIKSYYIDLSQYSLSSGSIYNFTYDVDVPDNLEYNDKSYATHAIYYKYQAQSGGYLELQTEPAKVGIRVAKTFNFETTKYKEATNRVVPNAIYKLKEYNSVNDVVQEKTLICNDLGAFSTKNLYVNAEYTLEETYSPNDYILNNNVIRFKVVENGDTLGVETLSTSGFRTTPTVTENEGKFTVHTEVEDAPKYKLNIRYVDSSVDEPIENAVIQINDEMYFTNSEGKVSVSELLPGNAYNLSEIRVNGCELKNHEIKLEKNGTEYTFNKDETITLDGIVYDETDQIQVNITVAKQGAARFNLNIVKVEKDDSITDLFGMEKLSGAEFSLNSEDNSIKNASLVVDENGTAVVNKLYQYNATNGIPGKYTLREEKAPDGYVLNQEEITFTVKTEADQIKVELENEAALTSIKDVQIDGKNVTLIIQDSPYFKLIKTDSQTGEPLAGVKFVIYELEEITESGVGTGEYRKVGFAKDINGNNVGIENDNGIYEVTTDSNGVIKLPLRDGLYQIEEIEALPGYICDRVERFKVANGATGTATGSNSGNENTNTNETQTTYTFVEPTKANTYQINNVNDLIALSNAVANGNTFSDTKVILNADLDFTGVTEFTPIGSVEHPFSGVFDGGNHKIQNLNLNGEGLAIFGYLQDAVVENLGVTGTITGTNDVAGIALKAVGSVKFSNCYNGATLNAKNAAGIVLYGSGDIELYNCYNTGTIGGASSKVAAGIVGKVDSKLLNGTAYVNTPQKFIAYECHNDGNITGSTSTSDYFAGIVAYIDGNNGTKHDFEKIDIVKCYNAGNVTAKRSAGIVCYMDLYNTSDLVVNVKECNNQGYVQSSAIIGQIYQGSGDNNTTYNIDKCNNNYTGDSKFGAGLIDNIYSYTSTTPTINITNCNNNADIDGSLGYSYNSYCGGIIDTIYCSKATVNISNCTNKGNVEKSGTCVAGVIGKINISNDGSANISNVKNEGTITSNATQSAGIIAVYDVRGSSPIISINNAINTGNVVSTNTRVGGIVGRCDYGLTQLNNCYNTGNISGSSNVSGIMGSTNDSVTFTKCYNTGNVASSSYYAGGILGYNESSYKKYEITDCYNTGAISGYSYVGGLVGYGYGAQGSKIDNSYNTGLITGESGYLGGIIGSCSDSSSLYVKISNTYNTGNITIGNNTVSSSAYYGGLVGYGSCEFENCSNKGNIMIGDASTWLYMGGFAGYGQYSKIRNCVNYGDLSGKSSNGISVGGISAYGCDVQDSYNYGNITAINTGSGSGYVGGISGYYGTSSGSGIINVFNKGDILTHNVSYTGGIAGYNNDEPIQKAYNSGKITSLGNANSSYQGTGGIAGYCSSSEISDCYNEGSILGTDKVGGIVGLASRNSTNYKNLYNIGNVSSNKNGTIGAIIGTEKGTGSYYNYNSLENAYYLDTIKLQSSKVLDNGTAKTWNEMISDDFYNTLNVDSVWVKRNNKAPTFNYSLPIVGTPTELKITNDKEEYIIATDVLGTGGTISGQSDAIYETVSAGSRSRKAILASPNAGYVLTSLSVNGSNIGFTPNAEGEVTLPEGFFTDMDENKVVVASFTEEDKILTINKTDSETNEPLEGAKFKISNYQGDWDTFKATYNTLVANRIGELTASATAGYSFTKDANGHYVSTNVGVHNSVSSSYVPIDLRGLPGAYKLTVTTSISSPRYDSGYLTIKETTDTPEYSDTEGRFYYDYANVTDDTNRTVLQGGKLYYLHMGYRKDANDNNTRYSYTDKFTVNSISIEMDDSSKVEEYVTTDSNGIATFSYPYDTVYLTEVVAPKGYRLDTQSHEYDLTSLTSTTLNITNQALPKVIAHYYLKEGETYTTKKLAEDVIYRGNVGDKYEAEIKAIDGFDLEVDQNNEYILPNNANGVFGAEDINVNFYYVANSIDLTIHHYKEGTLNKLRNDEVKTTPVNVTFDEQGNYTLSANTNYVVANNTNYQELVANAYSLVGINSNNRGNLSINDTLTYNSDSVLTYTYEEKDYTIKTRVAKHAETVLNSETNVEEQIMVAGGTISGEDLIAYETVNEGENATKDIVVTADAGYQIDTITVITRNDSGNETSAIVYGNGAVENPEITCEGTASAITLSKFQNIHANKEVVAKFAKADVNTKVIERYVDINTNEEVENREHEGYIGQEYNITPLVKEGYVLIEEDKDGNSLIPDNKTGVMTQDTIIVEFKVARKAKVTVKHISNNVLTPETLKPDVTINGYEGKDYITEAEEIQGYKLVETPENATGVMRVTVDPQNGTVNNETIVIYKYQKKAPANVVEKYVDINTESVITSIDHAGYVGDRYEITPKDNIRDTSNNEYVIVEKDKDGNNILPNNTIGTMAQEEIEVKFFVAKKADVRVKYINKETTAKVKEDTVIDGYEGKGYKVEKVEINGYELLEDETVGITEGNMPSGETVVTYYYKQIIPEVITVKAVYVEKDTNKKLADEEIYEGVEGETYTTHAKDIKNYKLVEMPENATGIMRKSEAEDGTITKEILVTYEYKENARTKVIEKYVDINTGLILSSVDHIGYVGEEYKINPNIEKGYLLIEKPDNDEGIMTEEEIVVVFKVAKEARVIVKYIVKYEDTELANEVIIDGYEGKKYKTERKDIDGYELIEALGLEEGTMKAGDNVVTYYYAKLLKGIIPQTGSNIANILFYAIASITIIIVANMGIMIVYKFKK